MKENKNKWSFIHIYTEDKPSTNLGQGDTDENLPEQNLDEQAPTPTETTGNETERTEYTTGG